MLQKLLGLRARDWADLRDAQIALCRAQLLVWTRRRGSLLTPVAGRASAADLPSSQRLAQAVSRVARYGLFQPKCLVQAIALQQLLESRGLTGSAVHIGVQRKHGHLYAHAWVEYQGFVLSDDEWRVQQFNELAQLGLSGRP